LHFFDGFFRVTFVIPFCYCLAGNLSGQLLPYPVHHQKLFLVFVKAEERNRFGKPFTGSFRRGDALDPA